MTHSGSGGVTHAHSGHLSTMRTIFHSCVVHILWTQRARAHLPHARPSSHCAELMAAKLTAQGQEGKGELSSWGVEALPCALPCARSCRAQGAAQGRSCTSLAISRFHAPLFQSLRYR